jgi:predicted GTPase
MGYSAAQLADLAATIHATPCDSVVIATPVNLARLINITQPCCRVRYDLSEITQPSLADIVDDFVERQASRLERS